jgi:hypothetical protein
MRYVFFPLILSALCSFKTYGNVNYTLELQLFNLEGFFKLTPTENANGDLQLKHCPKRLETKTITIEERKKRLVYFTFSIPGEEIPADSDPVYGEINAAYLRFGALNTRPGQSKDWYFSYTESKSTFIKDTFKRESRRCDGLSYILRKCSSWKVREKVIFTNNFTSFSIDIDYRDNQNGQISYKLLTCPYTTEQTLY